jgi:hypothetical protein
MGYDACIRDPTNTSRDAPEGAWVMTIHLSYPLTGFEFLKKSKTVIRIAVKN